MEHSLSDHTLPPDALPQPATHSFSGVKRQHSHLSHDSTPESQVDDFAVKRSRMDTSDTEALDNRTPSSAKDSAFDRSQLPLEDLKDEEDDESEEYELAEEGFALGREPEKETEDQIPENQHKSRDNAAGISIQNSTDYLDPEEEELHDEQVESSQPFVKSPALSSKVLADQPNNASNSNLSRTATSPAEKQFAKSLLSEKDNVPKSSKSSDLNFPSKSSKFQSDASNAIAAGASMKSRTIHTKTNASKTSKVPKSSHLVIMIILEVDFQI